MRRPEQVAAQLRALMDRHNLTARDIESLTGRDGRPPVVYITVRRILAAEARTEPEPGTLRRIAEAVGESYTIAFAEKEGDGIITIDVAQRGGRMFLHFVGGTVPPALEGDLRKVLDRHEKKLAKK